MRLGAPSRLAAEVLHTQHPRCPCPLIRRRTWILALGGTGIVVGLATYGHNIIRVLGVKATSITPSRGERLQPLI